jgi:hypothetical protein
VGTKHTLSNFGRPDSTYPLLSLLEMERLFRSPQEVIRFFPVLGTLILFFILLTYSTIYSLFVVLLLATAALLNLIRLVFL